MGFFCIKMSARSTHALGTGISFSLVCGLQKAMSSGPTRNFVIVYQYSIINL